jgi:RNA polymerase sigma factor (sigma-70 family)
VTAQPLDDGSLVRSATDGDEAATAELFARYADLLYAFIHHQLSSSRQDVEDVWQNAWLAAIQSLGTYDGRGRFFTWLCSIAMHKIADYYRLAARTTAAPISSLPPQNLAALTDKGPLPPEILMQQAARIQVVQALAKLPDAYRAVLVARYADGASVDQVARIVGKSYKAAESLLLRAKAALRKALAGPLQGDNDGRP